MAFSRIPGCGPSVARGAVLASVVFVILLGASLRAGPQASCAKGSKCPVVSLSVQIVDTDGNSAPYALQSDGEGLYIDGQEGVQATIGSNGFFGFNTGKIYPAPRTMISHYTNPLPGYSSYSLLVDSGANYGWAVADVITVPMQELATGQSMCKAAGIHADDPNDIFTNPPDEHYVTLFRSGVEGSGAPTSPTGMWLITRIDQYTWTVETSPTCKGYNVTAGDIVNLRHEVTVQSKKGITYDWVTIGYYHLPFKLILTDLAKPQ